MAKIDVRGLTKRFGQNTVVSDLNLNVSDGEFLVMLGPSGCGKSTILRMLAGLEEPAAGAVDFDGRPVDHLGPRERNVAFVFQSYALYPQMTVRQNLSFPLVMAEFRGWHHLPIVSWLVRRRIAARPDVRARVEEVAKELDLGHLLHRRPKALSGGQRQRVALGRAMVRKPAAFLMDEPLSNLDAVLRVSARSVIARLHHELGATIVYVTHDQTEAMSLGTRVLVLNEGVAQQCASPRTIYEKPANTFVASFVGSPPMNLIPGTLDGAMVSVGGVELELDGTLARAAAAWGGGTRRSVVVGVRPEAVAITNGSGSQALTGRIVTVEDNGSETILSLALDVQDAAWPDPSSPRRAFYAKVPGALRASVDGVVPVLLDPKTFTLFDPDSGQRIGLPGEEEAETGEAKATSPVAAAVSSASTSAAGRRQSAGAS